MFVIIETEVAENIPQKDRPDRQKITICSKWYEGRIDEWDSTEW